MDGKIETWELVRELEERALACESKAKILREAVEILNKSKMGWSYCGVNSTTGEEMGYSVEGVCHEPGCGKKIDHGLSFVCGSMHEGDGYGCGYYFCEKHLESFKLADRYVSLCKECAKEYRESLPA